MKKVVVSILTLFLIGVTFAMPINATTSTSDEGGYAALSIVWYYLYLRNEQKFDQLYNQSIQLGVDNQTLTLALELKQNATIYFNESIAYGRPEEGKLPILWKIRLAYLTIKEALAVLENAIQTLS
ncbi:MAG: pyrolysin [Thermococcus sp.]|uniref:pyrolysin n=1 Tax=Thermococcus sp. TaxID=35749 RepID=UPI001DCB50D9|nr:pyrolysin [Thermococcus sp.]MBO8175337.1 pyrolysin [Thermococcus sp.]